MKSQQWLLEELERWADPAHEPEALRAVRDALADPEHQRFATRLASAVLVARPDPTRTLLPPPC